MKQKLSNQLQSQLRAEIIVGLDELCDRIKCNEQETVQINFALGDLLNSLIDASEMSAVDASMIMEERSGIHHSLFQNYGRIARRLSAEYRPANVPWGVIKYLFVDINPRRFNVSEREFCRAAVMALREVEKKDLKLIDLKYGEDDSTLGESIIRKHVKK